MITYVYIVKRPECEDEFFDFFKEAEAYALSKLSENPIITQTEVNRNDFGECTDHCDLGTVWSWEDVMKDTTTDDEPAKCIFTKDDLKQYIDDKDSEFDNLDNSVDFEPEVEEVSASSDFRKPIPEGMTIEELVEAMEDNEDTVECTKCGNLVEKANCHHNKESFGWCCTDCEPADTLIVESEEPHDLGNTYDGGYPEVAPEGFESSKAATLADTVDLVYDELTIIIPGVRRDVDDWDEIEYTDGYTYTIDKDEVATTIWENFITEEDVAGVPGGLEALEDDVTWTKFFETHFDALFTKYYDNLLDYYEEKATAAFENESSYEDYVNNILSMEADAAYDDWRDSKFFD